LQLPPRLCLSACASVALLHGGCSGGSQAALLALPLLCAAGRYVGLLSGMMGGMGPRSYPPYSTYTQRGG
jgi:hypothetical protein